jgi:hypothetical protein
VRHAAYTAPRAAATVARDSPAGRYRTDNSSSSSSVFVLLWLDDCTSKRTACAALRMHLCAHSPQSQETHLRYSTQNKEKQQQQQQQQHWIVVLVGACTVQYVHQAAYTAPRAAATVARDSPAQHYSTDTGCVCTTLSRCGHAGTPLLRFTCSILGPCCQQHPPPPPRRPVHTCTSPNAASVRQTSVKTKSDALSGSAYKLHAQHKDTTPSHALLLGPRRASRALGPSSPTPPDSCCTHLRVRQCFRCAPPVRVHADSAWCKDG